jgi:hypothetical protein
MRCNAGPFSQARRVHSVPVLAYMVGGWRRETVSRLERQPLAMAGDADFLNPE